MLIQEDRLIPAILVLYCMPENDGEWLSIDENATTMRYCGYWKSLRGMPPSSNKATVRITIPTDQRFTESSLRSIMTRIKGGDFP